MDQNKLLIRLQELEREVAALRGHIGPQRTPWRRLFAKTGMFLVSYWVLMSFMAAIATATYVKYAFNIDYFETYRNASAVKRLSEFHCAMGDEMFLRNEWKQANACYKAATAANPANTAAALGEVKSAVFLPEDGRQYADPGTIAAKIRKLRALYPDDPQVAFLEICRTFDSDHNELVIAQCDELLKRHPDFAGGYLVKSFIQQGKADFKGAAATLERWLAIDPENGLAHSNLGYCHLFTGRRDEALDHLKKGNQFYPTMVNAISLAEVYRSAGDLAQASSLLECVSRNIAQPGVEREYYVGGLWLWNHLPESQDDTTSPKDTIRCATIEQKRAVLHISEGLLAAAGGDWDAAADKLDQALKLEPNYRAFIINKMRAAAFADTLEADSAALLRAAAEKLEKAGGS